MLLTYDNVFVYTSLLMVKFPSVPQRPRGYHVEPHTRDEIF